MVNMLKLSAKQLAETLGWSISFANGYIDGNTYRSRGLTPPEDFLYGTEEYAIGVQVGYNYGPDYLDWHDEDTSRPAVPTSKSNQPC